MPSIFVFHFAFESQPVMYTWNFWLQVRMITVGLILIMVTLRTDGLKIAQHWIFSFKQKKLKPLNPNFQNNLQFNLTSHGQYETKST